MDTIEERKPIVEAEPPLLTPEQISQYLNVDRKTVVNLIKAGELPGYRVGRQYRVKPAEFEKFMTESAS